MTGFHDVSFPMNIALNSEGGPSRRTDIVSLVSGREERNSPWAGSRRRYNVGLGVRSLADIEALIAFFEARRGRLYGFRFRDPFDHASFAHGAALSPTDQTIGAGDGVKTIFQLTKTYSSGSAAYARRIDKPVVGSVIVAVNGTPAPSASVDEATGEVSFATPPAAGAAVTAGFQFDVPVRFDTDDLRLDLAAFEAGAAPSIPLIEIAP